MLKKRRARIACWRWFFGACITVTVGLAFLHATKPSAIDIVVDAPFSSDFKNHIHDYVSMASITMHQWTCYVDAIVRCCPLVKSVRATLDPAGVVHVELAPVMPSILINDNYVVTENDMLVSRATYDPIVHNSLASLVVDKQWLEAWDVCQLKSVAARCTPKLTQLYEIHCGAPPLVHCDMRNHAHVSVLCDAEKLCSDEVLKCGAVALQYIEDKKILNDKQQRKWVVDTRFEKQVIVYAR